MKLTTHSLAMAGRIWLCIAWLLSGGLAVAANVDVSQLPPPADTKIDFVRDIKPILDNNCLRCHGPDKPKSHFRLDNREAALKGGDEGVDILPGDSTHSTLIHYVAYLVADSEMPPIGKGERLGPTQVGVLRAWIDQGLVWDTNAPANALQFSFTPALGGTIINGDRQKFRELNGHRTGWDGGLETFSLFEQIDPNTRMQVDGHALLDDYKIVMSLKRTDVGFIDSGWEQYRKYYDDTGGYYPALVNPPQSLGRDLHTDIGRAWIDFGLTLPDWATLVLGYEYDYKHGNEASTEWSFYGTDPNGRLIAPASRRVGEDTHIFKLDSSGEINGATITESFRGQFYSLDLSATNLADKGVATSRRERTSYFQGANTIRVEKRLNDWLFASGGYQYSKLEANTAFHMDAPTLQQITDIPRIDQERESHVGNVNALAGPFAGLTANAGVEADWTRQHSFGPGLYDQQSGPPTTDFFVPFTLSSDYDQTALSELAALHYAKIPFTTLYVEARCEQQSIAQNDQFAAQFNILNKAVFKQHTEFSDLSEDGRVGFDTSPWRSISFGAYYRRYDDRSDYDSAPLIQPQRTGYPTFIHDRDLVSDEAAAHLIWHPATWLKTQLGYQWRQSYYSLDTASYNNGPINISPGGWLVSGYDASHIVSFSATVVPIRRLFLTGILTWQHTDTTTFANGSPTVVPYTGQIWSVYLDGTWVANETTDLSVGYGFSSSAYAQNNFATGLPLGLSYQRHTVQAGVTHRLGKNVTTRLQYQFDYYDEPSTGGVNNYLAHTIFGTLAFQF